MENISKSDFSTYIKSTRIFSRELFATIFNDPRNITYYFCYMKRVGKEIGWEVHTIEELTKLNVHICHIVSTHKYTHHGKKIQSEIKSGKYTKNELLIALHRAEKNNYKKNNEEKFKYKIKNSDINDMYEGYHGNNHIVLTYNFFINKNFPKQKA